MRRPLADELDAYAAAASDFNAGTARIPDTLWRLPRAPGKWSPAEEAEHMTLAHELLAAQLAGAPPLRIVVVGWRQAALRWIVLPWILRTGRFPRGARSPREARPSAAPVPQRILASRLEAAAAGVRHEIARRGRGAATERMAHPYFGKMTALQALRLTTVHTRHHLAALSPVILRSG